jgi:hypothetical protein
MAELLKHLGFATPLIYAAAAYGLFHWLDSNASEDAKKALAGVMKFSEYDRSRLSAALVEVFDLIYTKPLLHWRAFARSSIISILVAAIYCYELGLFQEWSDGPASDGDADDIEIIYIIGSSLLFNILIDYLSLFVLRRWLLFCGNHAILALITGTIISVCIILLGYISRFLVSFLILARGHPDPSLLDPLWLLSWFPLLAQEPGYLVLPNVLVFTWLPLFAAGILVVQLMKPISWGVSKMQWLLKDGKERPLIAVGYVAGVIVFVLAAWGQWFFWPAPAATM